MFHPGMHVDREVRDSLHPRRDLWLALVAALVILLAFGAKAALGV